MLRIDLDAAGIAYETDDGFADFRSLRHSFISSLAAGGVHPKLAQQLARHSTIALTLDRYTHVGLLDMNTALESLPNIVAPESQTMRATGTTDALGFGCTNGCTRPAEINHSQPFLTGLMATEAASGQKRQNPQFSAENEGSVPMKAVGLEPTTYGLKVRGKSREKRGSQSVVAPKVASETVERGCEGLVSVGHSDPDLARLLKAWPKLTATVKRMILAVLDAGQDADR